LFFPKLAKLGQFVPKKNPLFMLQLARLFAFPLKNSENSTTKNIFTPCFGGLAKGSLSGIQK